MSDTLRVLFVEDSEDDSLLLIRELTRGGFEVVATRVQSGDEMRAALANGTWDLIVSDYAMPGFNALGSIAVYKASGVDIPFIVASGTIGEETAVEVLKAGADDFLLKDHLARFVPAVRRELREAAIRRGKREAERAVREVELRFRRIVETAQEGIGMIGPQGRFTYANDRLAEMLDARPLELYDLPLLELIDQDSKAAIAAKLHETSPSHDSAKRIECRLLRLHSGGELLASVAINAIDDGAGRHLGHLAMIVDVTEQRKLQEQLIVSDRMASVGTLAAGVAHEINNPLAVILANLHLAAEEIRRLIATIDPSLSFQELNEELRDAQHAAERVKNIVRDLKIFSRVTESTEPIEVQPVIESSLRMAWNEVRHRARIVRDYQAVPPIEGSESRLGQVFLNLITNAAHAMEEGQADRNELHLSTRVDELGRVVTEIGDSGVGMSPEVQRRIFTPFFTTKPAGVGTGLGLSICRQIVHSLGGEITVESTVGKGTVFRVALPQANGMVQRVEKSLMPPMKAPRRASILVVDDEPIVGVTVRRLLMGEHEVKILTSATDAIEHLATGARYDIILCDLMMPEVTGMDLYAAVHELSPEQAERMIFMTGGAFTARARAFLAEVTNTRVEKPFEPDGLRELVNVRLLEVATGLPA